MVRSCLEITKVGIEHFVNTGKRSIYHLHTYKAVLGRKKFKLVMYLAC